MNDFRPNIILDKLRNGDESPICELYQLYRNEFITWSKSHYNATVEQAKDAFQDAILDFHQNVISGRLTELSSTIKTYLFQIGKHKLLNIQKKDRRLTYHEALHLIENGEASKFMQEENKKYTQDQISEAIEKLPKDCQEVLKFYYLKEYDMESIAREMGYKNADTAKSKKSICFKKLTEDLKKISLLLVL